MKRKRRKRSAEAKLKLLAFFVWLSKRRDFRKKLDKNLAGCKATPEGIIAAAHRLVQRRMPLKRTKDGTGRQLATTLTRSLEQGNPLSTEEVRELIAHEARLLGLTYEQAIRRGRLHTLPRTYLGADLQLLVDLLHGSELPL
jgi:hypothetical protein